MFVSLHGLRHKLPPSPTRFPHLDLRLGLRLRDNTVGELLRLYHELGPAFTLRSPGIAQVFLVGPEANQYITVSNHRDFTWGDGFMGMLIPFIGYGLLTTDDEVHDRARRLLQPVFAPARIRAYAAQMALRAAAGCDRLQEGQLLEVHAWTRTLALSIAGELLFGFAPDQERSRYFARHFEDGLSFYGGPYIQTLMVRGPGTP
jgi:cytochrome P450